MILPLFFQKYEAKKKASFPSPFVAPAILEEQIEEQKGGPDRDRVIQENVISTPMPLIPWA